MSDWKFYGHLMVDLETLATRADAVVLSVGACAFDPEIGVGPAFYEVLDVEQQKAGGRFVDAATQAWWAQQSPEAQAVLTQDGRMRPALAIAGLAQFMAQNCQGKDTHVWGNGADFDNAILDHLCAWVGAPRPWGYHRGRCYRTLKGLLPERYARLEREVPRHGLHNARADAEWQAAIAVRLLRCLRGALASADSALALTDGDGSLAFGPIMAGAERDRLQGALNEYSRS